MVKYHLELNDVDDFIPEFSKKLGTGYYQKLGEYSMEIPGEIGAGKVHGINFPNGIGLYTYQIKFREKTAISLRHLNISTLRFLYCINGEFSSYTERKENLQEVRDHQYLIAAAKKDNNQTIILPENKEIGLCYLEIDRKKFQNYLSFNLNEVDPVFYKIFSDIESKNEIHRTGKFSLKVSDIIREIGNCKLSGFPRVAFLGAKALEVLSYMLTRFQKESKNPGSETLRDTDRKGLEKAIEQINLNIAKAGTVQELSEIAGMNSNKLQEGFQAVYGKTVNEYIRDIRLTKALDLLSSGRKNVSEVVYELGLSSRSYFSKIFKEKYGVSPRHIMKHKVSAH
ncbi:AraC family transcriptional regulator [Christiangramia salexigens]|uniref:AraC family transcriptional regulator n=1 Tax=Christiangramia salexigens TaxID=1913577 RepID=A0A1L3J2G8_9FLAO|nr:AraC family transcriptional regulator [Christiangramia salexigens]APG59321.1 AraC family transcriptional regulator [Christiangramia salexigens]